MNHNTLCRAFEPADERQVHTQIILYTYSHKIPQDQQHNEPNLWLCPRKCHYHPKRYQNIHKYPMVDFFTFPLVGHKLGLAIPHFRSHSSRDPEIPRSGGLRRLWRGGFPGPPQRGAAAAHRPPRGGGDGGSGAAAGAGDGEFPEVHLGRCGDCDAPCRWWCAEGGGQFQCGSDKNWRVWMRLCLGGVDWKFEEGIARQWISFGDFSLREREFLLRRTMWTSSAGKPMVLWKGNSIMSTLD